MVTVILIITVTVTSTDPFTITDVVLVAIAITVTITIMVTHEVTVIVKSMVTARGKDAATDAVRLHVCYAYLSLPLTVREGGGQGEGVRG